MHFAVSLIRTYKLHNATCRADNWKRIQKGKDHVELGVNIFCLSSDCRRAWFWRVGIGNGWHREDPVLHLPSHIRRELNRAHNAGQTRGVKSINDEACQLWRASR